MINDGNDLGASEPASVDTNSTADASATRVEGFVISDDIAPPKRYAHFGKRRRSFTEELFRCQYVDKISRSDLVCNALLWRNRPAELRKHLLEHLTKEQVSTMADDQVVAWYVEAKHIMLTEIPEDSDFSDDYSLEDLDDLEDLEEDE